MKKIIIILPLISVLVACGPQKPNGTKAELKAKLDSLEKAETEIKLELNKVIYQLRIQDTTNTTDELKLIKQISMQNNKVVKMQKKLKELENELESLSKERKLVKVAVKDLKPEEFKHYLKVYGEVDAENYSAISPEMPGQIKKIHVEAGEYATKGQLLITLNTDAINQQIKSVKTNLELAKTTFEKTDALWKQNIGSEIQFLQAKSAKESLEAQLKGLEAQKRMSEIRAPFNGYVDKIFQKEGELASSMMPLMEFVNLGELKIIADVSEKYIGDVNKGDVVEVTFDVLEDTISTKIVRTAKVLDAKSRTFEIEVHLNNKEQKIKPNMVSTIRINDYKANDALVIPSLVIMKDITGDYVYLVNEKDGKSVIDKRYITTLLSYEEKSVIAEGLNPNDKVVIEGYHLVSSGMEVEVDNK
ncbi:MAG: efflux RND transporter periplasmic adaptor subunit [Bacteroidales bacterium]|nr:efflux RND transporter periplasmic adaptor subunit [Bacteroidales bacterium]